MRKSTADRGRGIVLVTTICVMVFLVMLATMVTDTGYNSLRRASSFVDSEQAYNAALTGLVWAQMELEANMDWMSSGWSDPEDGVTRADGRLSISDSNRVIDGFISSSSGSGRLSTSDASRIGTGFTSSGDVSEFRISFNPAVTGQDANDTPPIAYTSYNSLPYDQAVDHSEVDSYSSAAGGYSTFRTVPPQTATVVVEGLIRDTVGNVKSVRYVEASFKRDITQIVDSVAFSGKDMSVTVPSGGQWNLSLADGVQLPNGATPPGLRPLGGVTLTAPGYDPTNPSGTYNNNDAAINLVPNGTGGYEQATAQGFTGGPSTLPGGTEVAKADSLSKFPKITTAMAATDAPLGSASFSAKTQVQAGTYVYWDASNAPSYYKNLYVDDPSNSKYVFNSSDKSISVLTGYDSSTTPPTPQYSNYAANAVGAGSPFGSSLTVTLSAATQVTPTSMVDDSGTTVTTSGISIIGVPTLTTGRPSVTLTSPSSATSAAPVLYNQSGDVYIGGDVTGQGSVVAGGNITFQGHSALKPSSDVGISLYAGGDITLAPITGTGSVSGLVTPATATQTVLTAARSALSSKYGTSIPSSVITSPSDISAIKNASVTDPTGAQESLAAYLLKYGYASNSGNGAGGAVDFITTALSDNATTGNINTTASTTSAVSYKDQIFYGMVYTQHDFTATVGDHTLTINGALVAYGGDPSTQQAGTNGGNISISGTNVNFTYDPSYLGALSRMFPTGIAARRQYFTTY